MGVLRAQTLRMLHSLSYMKTLAMQSTKEPVLSSSANGSALRAIVSRSMHTPSVVSKCISFQWGVLNSNAGSSYSTSSEGNNNNNTNSGDSPRRKRPPADVSSLFPGRDDKHWLIILQHPEGEPSKEEMIGRYVKLLTTVLGSEEAAIKSIYSVSFDRLRYHGFGCEISKEDAEKLKGLPGVFMIFQDSWVDPVNKDYGGELFVDGKIVQRSPERQKLIDRTPEPSRERSRNRARGQASEYQGPINLSLSSEVDG